MQVMKDIGGVEMPDYLAKMSGDGAAHNGHAAAAAASGNGDVPPA
jgi:hypothetical protein